MDVKAGQVYKKISVLGDFEVEVLHAPNVKDSFGVLPVFCKQTSINDKTFCYSTHYMLQFKEYELIKQAPDDEIAEFVEQFTKRLEIDYILDRKDEEEFYKRTSIQITSENLDN